MLLATERVVIDLSCQNLPSMIQEIKVFRVLAPIPSVSGELNVEQ